MPTDEPEIPNKLFSATKDRGQDSQAFMHASVKAAGNIEDLRQNDLGLSVKLSHDPPVLCERFSEIRESEQGAKQSQDAGNSKRNIRSYLADEASFVQSQDESLPDPSKISSSGSFKSAKPNDDLSIDSIADGSKFQGHQDVSTAIPENKVSVSDGGAVIAASGVSGWSHQAIAPHKMEKEEHHDDEWQDMPAFAPYDLYDDDGKLIAREARDSDEEENAYTGLGGAGKGYTRVQIDEDAQSATSMDDNTSYLFKANGTHLADEDEELRDAVAQMQATKDLLTEGQRIAYVGVTRLAIALMVKELDGLETTKGTKKEFMIVVESMKMWAQQMMLRLYAHMEINSSGN